MTKTYESKSFVPSGRLPYECIVRLVDKACKSGNFQLQQLIDAGPRISLKDVAKFRESR
ncbi:MAG: hypothetical protein IKP35_03395 [Alphaproteobacteria bacterium]|nr:hypothetical protein [Alphaproteobacteria bacterium]